MADTENYLSETGDWVEAIYQIETDDSVIGGPTGIANRQPRELADRTVYLKTLVEALSAQIVAASTTTAGIIELATVTEAKAGTDAARAVTPAGLAAAIAAALAGLSTTAATEDAAGIVELATLAEALAGTDAARAVTPAGLAAALSALASEIEALFPGSATDSAAGIVELATTAEALAGTDAARAVTPAGLTAAIDDAMEAQSLGYGQTLQAVTRTGGVTYYNDTGRPIFGFIVWTSSVNASSVSISINGGTAMAIGRAWSGGTSDTSGCAPYIISPSESYAFTYASISGGAISAFERR